METEEKKIYTIEDIARELGVSKTTVSRAISGKGRISQATRDRVRAFIKEHDYRPNVVAKGLAQRKTYNIALLMPKDYVATEFLFFKDCMNGICEMASSYEYDIIISMIDGADVSQIQRLEANRKVDGIIVSRAVVSSKVQKYLKNCKEPYILIGPSSDPEVPFVDNKNQEAGKELTEAESCKLLSAVGLCSADYLNRQMDGTLSGGEMKRLEIATVLAKPHKVSIFDEPEAGIDLWSFSMLIRRFEEIHKEKRECLILISHQERIIQMADKIMVIEDGQVKEYGTKEDVLPTLFQQKTGRMCGQEGGTC